MKFTNLAALVAMIVSSNGAHAVLSNSADNGLTIDNDAVTSYGYNSANNTTEWYVSGNGSFADSFFTMGGNKNKQAVDSQFAYLTAGTQYYHDDLHGTYVGDTYLSLDGATQPNIATFTFFSNQGSLKTTGTGVSILSASGDTATVDMSGLTINWYGTDYALGTGAWSTGYTHGVGNITCEAGGGCERGSAYTLKYTATLPADAPYLGSFKFYLELHGMVGCTVEGCPTPTIPEASTYAMMLAGLGLVGLMVRRRRKLI